MVIIIAMTKLIAKIIVIMNNYKMKCTEMTLPIHLDRLNFPFLWCPYSYFIF